MSPIARFCLCCAALLFGLAAHAAPIQGLYRAEVEVDDQSESAREQGLQRALQQVMVRVTGDPDIAYTSDGRAVAEQARQLVQQFGYKRVAASRDSSNAQDSDDDNETSAPATRLHLRVKFNRGAVNNALRRAGLPVWGSERPETLLWLAQAQGGAPELLSGSAVGPARNVADKRGLAIRVAEAGDGATAADVIAGYDDRLRSAARARGLSNMLVGKLRNQGGLWSAEWRLMQGEQTLKQWRDSAERRDQLVAEGLRRLANIYAQRYAVRGGSSSEVALAVDGVGSQDAFARVSRYLADLTAVEQARPLAVTPDYVVFSVTLSGDAAVFERSLGLADMLTRDDAARDLAGLHATGATALGYRYSK